MQQRNIIDLLVMPKYFHVLSFYSKGTYSIRIKLVSEQLDSGKLIYGWPILHEGKDARKQEDRKASTPRERDQICYQTEKFYVTFSEQKIILNTLCIFRQQFDQSKQYKTYLEFQLMMNHPKLFSSTTARKITKADKRRIYLPSIKSLNHYKRVLFDQSDYFSTTDVYLLSGCFGQKHRINPYRFGQFVQMGTEIRQKIQLSKQQKQVKGKAKSMKFASIYIGKQGIVEFYKRMIVDVVSAHRKLCLLYQNWRFNISSMTSASHLVAAQKLPSIDWLPHPPPSITLDWITQHYQNEQTDQLYLTIYEESHEILRNTRYVWQILIELLKGVPFTVVEILANAEIIQSRRRRNQWVHTFQVIQLDRREEKRQEFITKRAQILSRMDMYEEDDAHHPFIIIENFTQCTITPSSQIDSLAVFVHGYQGSDIDLEKARNFLNIYNANCYGLLVKSVQDEMEESIEHLGALLANEIKLHILNSVNQYKRINIIGYSLGGILARQALKHMDKYKDKMNIFISFASPHTGITECSNFLVKTGVWFLTNFDKGKNLRQLVCKPNENESITLWNLSECESLSWFNRFVVVSSKEDDFVPYRSSRLDVEGRDNLASEIGKNIMRRLKKLQRVEVWFDVDHCVGTMDKILGRRAHIQFLQNRMFLDSFFSVYAPLL